ncbi:4-hydroxy-tetrahydrodipicolinate synthase [Sporosarcina pasteurii]|uniref:4-hydroxy-tetrahydrodipicolinate synthase n=1 Tax=Sporosarcina pasteurii TaxID=1474 RepID=A0A380BH84_SPOPA|nr:4-hydroxy-tetrahydrodipicolinate synthase [Sporosarcina pasteurii]MDS9470635.1 4-hydroxy-tetrahydrodipicolinate synthase [Sporosarcina pasteurii]QBQ05679.1 4-hydroxy-tetrahydrodipicolinate synthase [Sporosarcina pasteurii]SUJ01389.1 Dihydrodipicolinate synthase [Sporosarcina pasteurii]
MELGRISTAMVTPFSQTGDIDFEKTDQLIEHLIANGSDSIVVCGTTGESPTLTRKEVEELLTFAVKKVNGRIPIIAGTGSNSTAGSMEATKLAEQCGVDGIMLVTPYYNKPDQKGLFAHFSAIAKETELPILLYNIPGRSVINMLPETTIALSKIKNIHAIKEASGDLEQMAAIISGTEDDFKVYSGDDALALPLLAIGGDGVVSVASHVVGNEMQKMMTAYLEGRTTAAATMHRTLLPLFTALFTAPNPVPIKHALKVFGVDVGEVRLPLVGLKDKECVNQAIKNLQSSKRIFI